MRMIPVLAAGLLAVTSIAAPAAAQYRHGWGHGWHGDRGGHRGYAWGHGREWGRGYGWRGGHRWHGGYARVACTWRWHHRICRRVWY